MINEGRKDELKDVFMDIAHDSHAGCVTVDSMHKTCDIDIDSVTVLQGSSVRNPMHKHLVHRCTHRLRKAIIVYRRWVRIRLYDGVVDGKVDFVGGSALANCLEPLNQRLSCDIPSMSHPLEHLLVFDWDWTT